MHGVADIAIGSRLSRLVLRDVTLPLSDHRRRPGRTFAEQIDGVMCTAHPQMLKGSLERIWLAVAGRSGTQRQNCRDTAPSYDLSVRFQTRHRAVRSSESTTSPFDDGTGPDRPDRHGHRPPRRRPHRQEGRLPSPTGRPRARARPWCRVGADACVEGARTRGRPTQASASPKAGSCGITWPKPRGKHCCSTRFVSDSRLQTIPNGTPNSPPRRTSGGPPNKRDRAPRAIRPRRLHPAPL